MSVRSGLVRKIVRGGKPRLVIDIQYRDREGRLRRYRRDATLQTAAGARAEAERLYLLAMSTGCVEGQEQRECLTFRVDAFGSQRLDRIDTPGLRAFVAELLERKVQARGPLNFVRTVLSAAVDAGALEALPAFPRIRRQGRKLPDAPSEEEVRAMLAHARGWLRTAVALAALAGLRMGEVRALEVRDVDLTDEAVGYDRKRLATALRDDLKAVGVTRALLFEEDAPNVEALRFHDLRSTFCTWSRRVGKSDAWISERTGHELSGDMINRYDRGATTLEDLAYAPFPPIGRAVPELAAMADALAIVRTMALALANSLAKLDLLDPTNDTTKEVETVAMTGTYDAVGARGFEP